MTNRHRRRAFATPFSQNLSRTGMATLALAAAFCAMAIQAARCEETAANLTAPNIVFIMADDLGYGDLGCYGQERILTPNIDKLAREGMRFTQFYAGSTVCAPSRCVLMTGYHTGHAYIRGNGSLHLRPGDVTMAECLKAAGYQTGQTGKWGLGYEGDAGAPTRQGFDFFFGYLSQTHAHNYYPTFLIRNETRVRLPNVVPNERRGQAEGAGHASVRKVYSHDLIMGEALKFVEQSTKADKPFFLYASLTLPHANNEAGREGMEVPDLGPYAEKDWPAPQKGHAAMITRMDDGVGKLMKLLEELGVADNTLVFFTSDNGPHAEGGNNPDFQNSNGPLRGIKRSLHDGGIRVPLIAHWPGKIKAGSESDFIGCFQDILPTVAELAGPVAQKLVPEDIDGVSIVPTLLGEPREQRRHEYLYWAFYEQGGGQAVRSGQWKAVQQPVGRPVRLYRISTDIGEQDDVAADHPDVVAQMKRHMEEAYEPSPHWKWK